MNHKRKLLIAAFILIAGISSCTLPQKTVQNKAPEIPSKFSAVASSGQSVAGISRDDFFKDPKLHAVIKDVLKHNPDVYIAMDRIKIAGAWFKISKGAMLPSLHATAQASATKFGKYTMEGVGNFDTNLSPNIDNDQRIGSNPTPDFWLGLSSSWEVDIWGKLSKMKEASRQRYLATNEGAAWLKSMLVANSATLYYELIALDNERVIIEENIRLQERALEIVEGQKEGGRATELAVQQFRAQLLNTKATAFSVQQRIKIAEMQLNTLAGRFEGKIDRDSSLQFRSHFDSTLTAGVPASLLQNRADVREAQAQLNATDADLSAARKAFLPNLTISASTAFNAFKGDLLFSASSLGFQVLGGLTAPIFQRHQLKSQFRIADATQDQAYYELQKTVLNAWKEVEVNLSAISNLQSMIGLKKQEVHALDKAVDASTDLYVAGYASYLEIVAAQRSKLEAELGYLNLQRDRIQAVVELYKALGGG